MRRRRDVTPYQFSSAGIYGAAGYLAPAVDPLLTALPRGSRVLDVGCGNGYWPGRLAAMGFQVIGIDPSPSGIALARTAHPAVRFEERALSEDLLTDLGEPPFDAVVSFEVVEHLYAPARWAAACFKAIKPDGLFICSAPYHGYLRTSSSPWPAAGISTTRCIMRVGTSNSSAGGRLVPYWPTRALSGCVFAVRGAYHTSGSRWCSPARRPSQAGP